MSQKIRENPDALPTLFSQGGTSAATAIGHLGDTSVTEARTVDLVRHAFEAHAGYLAQADQAKEAGNLQQAEHLRDAAGMASSAADSFDFAAQATVKLVKNSHAQAGSYYMQAAQSQADGKPEEAERFNKAADLANDATCHFQSADEVTNLEERKRKAAHTQAGDYSMRAAQAQADGKPEEAEYLDNAANMAGSAALFLKEVDKATSIKAKEAYTQAADCYMKAAQEYEKKNSEQAKVFNEQANAFLVEAMSL